MYSIASTASSSRPVSNLELYYSCDLNGSQLTLCNQEARRFDKGEDDDAKEEACEPDSSEHHGCPSPAHVVAGSAALFDVRISDSGARRYAVTTRVRRNEQPRNDRRQDDAERLKDREYDHEPAMSLSQG